MTVVIKAENWLERTSRELGRINVKFLTGLTKRKFYAQRMFGENVYVYTEDGHLIEMI